MVNNHHKNQIDSHKIRHGVYNDSGASSISSVQDLRDHMKMVMFETSDDIDIPLLKNDVDINNSNQIVIEQGRFWRLFYFPKTKYVQYEVDKKVNQWTSYEVSLWIKGIYEGKFESYSQYFIQHQIDGNLLLNITRQMATYKLKMISPTIRKLFFEELRALSTLQPCNIRQNNHHSPYSSLSNDDAKENLHLKDVNSRKAQIRRLTHRFTQHEFTKIPMLAPKKSSSVESPGNDNRSIKSSEKSPSPSPSPSPEPNMVSNKSKIDEVVVAQKIVKGIHKQVASQNNVVIADLVRRNSQTTNVLKFLNKNSNKLKNNDSVKSNNNKNTNNKPAKIQMTQPPLIQERPLSIGTVANIDQALPSTSIVSAGSDGTNFSNVSNFAQMTEMTKDSRQSSCNTQQTPNMSPIAHATNTALIQQKQQRQSVLLINVTTHDNKTSLLFEGSFDLDNPVNNGSNKDIHNNNNGNHNINTDKKRFSDNMHSSYQQYTKQQGYNNGRYSNSETVNTINSVFSSSVNSSNNGNNHNNNNNKHHYDWDVNDEQEDIEIDVWDTTTNGNDENDKNLHLEMDSYTPNYDDTDGDPLFNESLSPASSFRSFKRSNNNKFNKNNSNRPKYQATNSNMSNNTLTGSIFLFDAEEKMNELDDIDEELIHEANLTLDLDHDCSAGTMETVETQITQITQETFVTDNTENRTISNDMYK